MKRITITSSSSLPSLKVGGIPGCLAAKSSIKLCVAWSLYKHKRWWYDAMQWTPYHLLCGTQSMNSSLSCWILFIWKCLNDIVFIQGKVNSKSLKSQHEFSSIKDIHFPVVWLCTQQSTNTRVYLLFYCTCKSLHRKLQDSRPHSNIERLTAITWIFF